MSALLQAALSGYVSCNAQQNLRPQLGNSLVSKAPSPTSTGFSGHATAGMRRASRHYLSALQLAREQDFESARAVFSLSTQLHPEETQAWVSWAQMEKRFEKLEGSATRFARCRRVLQQGLTLNPNSAQICQAWGLLELQAGNTWAALALLERSVRADPKHAPVLRWRVVQAARLTVSSRRQHVSRSKLSTSLGNIQ